MTDDQATPAPQEPGGDEELEIEFHGEPGPVSEQAEQVMEVTVDDLPEVSETGGLPALSELDAGVTDAAGNWVDIPAVCSETETGFVVRFRQVEPSRFAYAGAEQPHRPRNESATRTGRNVKGEFALSDYPGCPVCGAPGLVVCSGCGTVSCGASVRQAKQGLVMTCPHCHRDGQVQAGGPGTQVWATGGPQKKKYLD